MAAIVRAASQQDWRSRIDAQVACVISNKADAHGLTVARGLGLATEVVDHRAFATRADFDAALAVVVQRYQPSLVVLAGFMRVLTPEFVERFAGRMVNIHPSLLPAFPGLHTHQRALDAGCRVAGASVHYVTHELDSGRILAQAVVPVLTQDTADSLAARVLTQEHLIYPAAICALLART